MGVLKLCCPVNWQSRKTCHAWGAPGTHGCKYDPGHSGSHRCPCGSRHEPDLITKKEEMP